MCYAGKFCTRLDNNFMLENTAQVVFFPSKIVIGNKIDVKKKLHLFHHLAPINGILAEIKGYAGFTFFKNSERYSE